MRKEIQYQIIQRYENNELKSALNRRGRVIYT